MSVDLSPEHPSSTAKSGCAVLPEIEGLGFRVYLEKPI